MIVLVSAVDEVFVAVRTTFTPNGPSLLNSVGTAPLVIFIGLEVVPLATVKPEAGAKVIGIELVPSLIVIGVGYVIVSVSASLFVIVKLEVLADCVKGAGDDGLNTKALTIAIENIKAIAASKNKPNDFCFIFVIISQLRHFINFLVIENIQ